MIFSISVIFAVALLHYITCLETCDDFMSVLAPRRPWRKEEHEPCVDTFYEQDENIGNCEVICFVDRSEKLVSLILFYTTDYSSSFISNGYGISRICCV